MESLEYTKQRPFGTNFSSFFHTYGWMDGMEYYYFNFCRVQVRAQVVVLKKALLDEREKHSYIKDNDVGKGQKIRTLEQEVSFANFLSCFNFVSLFLFQYSNQKK